MLIDKAVYEPSSLPFPHFRKFFSFPNDETRAVTKIVPREDSRNNHNNEGSFSEITLGLRAGLKG